MEDDRANLELFRAWLGEVEYKLLDAEEEIKRLEQEMANKSVKLSVYRELAFTNMYRAEISDLEREIVAVNSQVNGLKKEIPKLKELGNQLKLKIKDLAPAGADGAFVVRLESRKRNGKREKAGGQV